MVNKIIDVKFVDLVIIMYICCGNFCLMWFLLGGYEFVVEMLFGICCVDGFFLEYDSDCLGDFKLLCFIKD